MSPEDGLEACEHYRRPGCKTIICPDGRGGAWLLHYDHRMRLREAEHRPAPFWYTYLRHLKKRAGCRLSIGVSKRRIVWMLHNT